MAEWSKAPDLKSGRPPKGLVGSNPTPSATAIAIAVAPPAYANTITKYPPSFLLHPSQTRYTAFSHFCPHYFMKHFPLLFLVSIGLLTTACSAPVVPPSEEVSSASSVPMLETNNVLYRGILEEAGVTIFMQGTHRLTLDDGRFILLESETVSMDDYLGERVEVRGSIRPTEEAGSQIMRVQSVTLLNASSSATSSELSETTSGSSVSSVSEESTPSSRTTTPPVSSVTPITPPTSAAAPASSVAQWDASDELTEKALTMSKVNMDATNWTQEYCSTHWKFCIPVHRNWWFKSFGATATSLWHVEIGPLEMNNLGEGPLMVNLMNDSIEAAGAADGQVTVTGDTVTGYRSWEGGRHFEVRGPAILEQAIRVITGGLRPSEG